jgi:hypothetical protein
MNSMAAARERAAARPSASSAKTQSVVTMVPEKSAVNAIAFSCASSLGLSKARK